MTRFKDKESALALRKLGMSYSQIKKIIKVGKSTLSYWLKNYPLSKKRVAELRDKNEIRIEKYRETMRQKKENRLEMIYKLQKKQLLPINKRELLLAGLFLYWGEGSKFKAGTVSLSNTDPDMIKFFIYWLEKCLLVPRRKIKIDLQLYRDMDITKKIKYWSKTLKITIDQFSKPYIKKDSSTKINHKGTFGHGTCNARVGGARLIEKILMGIKAIIVGLKI